MLTVFLSLINFFSGSAFQGIVSAVTGVIGKLSSDQATASSAALVALDVEHVELADQVESRGITATH